MSATRVASGRRRRRAAALAVQDQAGCSGRIVDEPTASCGDGGTEEAASARDLEPFRAHMHWAVLRERY